MEEYKNALSWEEVSKHKSSFGPVDTAKEMLEYAEGTYNTFASKAGRYLREDVYKPPFDEALQNIAEYCKEQGIDAPEGLLEQIDVVDNIDNAELDNPEQNEEEYGS